jgi:DNA-binding PadR family transcriptional regulator
MRHGKRSRQPSCGWPVSRGQAIAGEGCDRGRRTNQYAKSEYRNIDVRLAELSERRYMAGSVAKCVVLGLLGERPGYPYELARRFERRAGPAWRINDGHFYLAVADLERQGMIELSPKPSGYERADGRRRVMRLTERGRDELERWFARPIQEGPGRIRSELAAKLLLTDATHAEVVLENVERYVRSRIEEANDLACSRERLPDTIDWETALAELLHEAALSTRIAEMHWLRAAHEMLTRLASQPSPDRQRQRGAPDPTSSEREGNELAQMLGDLRARNDELLRDRASGA